MKYLAACCTVKNEAPIIGEWIAFHRAVGVDAFVIIDNGSSDATYDVVSSFKGSADVHVIRWPGPGTQVDMYNHVISNFSGSFRWCAFIDADEFLFPVSASSIKDVLHGYEMFGGVGVHWLVYGSSNHLSRPSGLVIESYLLRSEESFLFNKHVKTIVQMRFCKRALSSHVFEVENDFVNDSKQILHQEHPFGFYEDRDVSFRSLRINHYHTRSRQDYLEKATKGYFGVDDMKLATEKRREDMFTAHDRNDVYDDSARRFLRATQAFLSNGR